MEEVLSRYARIVMLIVICFITALAIHSMHLSIVFTQELESRLHTDWAIVDYEITPLTPRAGENVKLQVSLGIAAIIEPLPQTVEVMLKIDGVQRGLRSLVFEGDPRQIKIVQVDWAATSGKHYFEWIIDPYSKYDDPDLENNYVAFNLEVAPAAEIESVTTTIIVTETFTRTQIVETVVSAECPEISPITETVTRGETITMISETVRTETITETSHHSYTVTEKITEMSTTSIKELDILPLGVYGGLSAFIAGILGLILGRKFLKKPEPAKTTSRVAIFSTAVLRPAKKLDENVWEARPGETVEEARGIVTIDENGDTSIITDHQCLYSSKINRRPLAREDFEKMDRRVLEGLLDQLKSTRQTTEAMELELNDKQKQAIEEVMRRMGEELSRRKLIQ